MAYTFDMLGNEFTAAHFGGKMKRFFDANTDGWPCWSFSNHDVDRHVSRWSKHALDPAALARQSVALLIALRGSICVYQGEELGLPQSEILFEERTDPPGIRFWPEYKGRDGERTPMPWEAGEAPNGFTTGTPWLPVKPNHAAMSVAAQEADPASTLHAYRQALAFRRAHPALVEGGFELLRTAEPVLAFRRRAGTESLLCIYNLSPDPVRVGMTGEGGFALSQAAERKRDKLVLGASGYAIMAEPADAPLRIDFRRRARPRR
jgi:alpha-glucosidase